MSRRWRASEFTKTGSRAFERNRLAAASARSGKVRRATWGEIDLDRAVWTIPSERMKAGRNTACRCRTGRSPYSTRPDGILLDAGGLVFASPTGKPPSRQVMANPRPGARAPRRAATVPLQLSRLGRRVHGGAARGLRARPGPCQQRPLESAYRRSDLFERRRTLMQQWADYLAATT